MAAKGAPPVAGRVGRPLLLYATALSWVLLAGVCSVQYLAGRTQLMPVRCQSALVLQPAAVVGAAAAAAAERQEAPDAAQQEQPGLALTPGKRQPVTKSAEQQQLLGEQLEQPAAAASARAGGHGDGGDSSTSSSDGGDSSSSGAGATHAAGGSGSDASGSAASSRLPASWRDVDALIQAPSPLHGLQKKGGLPNRCGLAVPAWHRRALASLHAGSGVAVQARRGTAAPLCILHRTSPATAGALSRSRAPLRCHCPAAAGGRCWWVT